MPKRHKSINQVHLGPYRFPNIDLFYNKLHLLCQKNELNEEYRTLRKFQSLEIVMANSFPFHFHYILIELQT